MKRFVLLFAILGFSLSAMSRVPGYYFIKVYRLANDSQQLRLDSFLEHAYLPALHRAGVKQVGVFKKRLNEKDSLPATYVFMSFPSLDAATEAAKTVDKDPEYIAAGKGFTDAPYNNVAFDRIESIILSPFAGTTVAVPRLNAAKSDRVYELRSYEGPSEKILDNKIRMFTAGGETAIFNRLGFQPVFYGRVIAGDHMPNLMYLTVFENKDEREKHWSAFGNDPAWKKLSAEPGYQNNVSHIDTYMLYPADYSDM